MLQHFSILVGSLMRVVWKLVTDDRPAELIVSIHYTPGMENVPIFPLPLVLLPATRLPLQIFELRYRRMVKECLANETGFVITYASNYGEPSAISNEPSAISNEPSAISKEPSAAYSGSSATERKLSNKSPSAAIAATATYCEIVDWQPMPDQMIGILVQGLLKVRIEECGTEPDGLISGKARVIETETELVAPTQSASLETIIKRLLEDPLVSLLPLKFDAGNALNISYQLADLLPFTTAQKQQLLELSGPAERLEQILQLLKEL